MEAHVLDLGPEESPSHHQQFPLAPNTFPPIITQISLSLPPSLSFSLSLAQSKAMASTPSHSSDVQPMLAVETESQLSSLVCGQLLLYRIHLLLSIFDYIWWCDKIHLILNFSLQLIYRITLTIYMIQFYEFFALDQ